MNNTTVIICNYNGGKSTIKCIGAVLKSQDIASDIYVIDNASTDGSVKQITESFGSFVSIIQNSENLGGSGGFGKGLFLYYDAGQWCLCRH